jgi:hypothetical protein
MDDPLVAKYKGDLKRKLEENQIKGYDQIEPKNSKCTSCELQQQLSDWEQDITQREREKIRKRIPSRTFPPSDD